MKLPKLLMLLLIFTVNSLQSQNWIWSTAIHNHTGSAKLCKDPWNNVYYYDPDAYSVPNTTTTIRKLNAAGSLLWQVTLPQNMQIKTVAASADGHVYMGGTFGGTITIAGSTHVGRQTDIWITKFTGSGAPVWCKTIGSKDMDFLGEICMAGSDLILTGQLSDTTNFMGNNIPKPSSSDFFIAKVNSSGAFQAIKLATALSYSIPGSSWGNECAVDPWGNVFVFAQFGGRSKVDTFHVGIHNEDQQVLTTSLLKFNPQLQVQFTKQLTLCTQICTDQFTDLHINNIGEPYYIQSYDYSQSGNDDHRSWINRLSPSGALTNTYQPRPDLVTSIGDMDLDDCGNVYYTGIARDYINLPVFYPSLMVGKLSPDLTSNWRRLDSTSNNYAMRYGTAIAALVSNNIFVGGIFSDTLQLASTLIDTNNYYGRSVFFASITDNVQTSCEYPSTVGLQNHAKRPEFSFFPNPCSDIIHISTETHGSEIYIYSCDGKLMRNEKLKEETNDIHLNELPPGLYFLRIHLDGLTMTDKLIIQRN